MSFRTRVAWLSAAIVLLAALYAGSFVFSPESEQAHASREALFPAFRPKDAESIRIVPEQGAVIELTRTTAGWTTSLEGARVPVSSLRVAGLLASIEELSRTKVAAANASLFASFGLVSEEGPGVAVRGSGGKRLAALLVGQKGESGYEDYLRIPGESRVYLTRSSMSFYVTQQPSYWYDLALFPEEVEGPRIVSIAVEGEIPLDSENRDFSREGYTIVRGSDDGGSEWRFEGDGGAVNQIRADVSANALGTLQGVDFVVDPSRLSNAVHRLRVVVKTSSGSSYSITAGASRLAGYWVVQGSDPGLLYVVRADALRRAVADSRELSVTRQ